VRSYLIHRLSPLGADAGAILGRLDAEPDITIRRALVLGLGEFSEEELSPAARTALIPRLQEIYRHDADPGLHASVEWLLRHWKQDDWLKQVNEEWAKNERERNNRIETIRQLVRKHRAKTPPQWYVNGQGQTMVVLPGPVEFWMGSPPTEEGRSEVELQHKVRIGRTFALAVKPVTLTEYRRFDPEHTAIWRWVPTGDSPAFGSWFQAAAYCNWLSKQEGLPESEWCYEPLQDPQAMPALAGSNIGLLAGPLAPLVAACDLFPGRTDPEFKPGMKLARDYLKRTGYRLPTEAEMEYATRAGAVTSWYFGETPDLLPRYAWYQKNSKERTWLVGSKKPNDLGLFDLHGNTYCWCQEQYKDYPLGQGEEAWEDKEDTLIVNAQDSRVIRGGSFSSLTSGVRSANRGRYVPAIRVDHVGFRPARTVAP
jgi:formylglycine-generating enzyme required for sulfatase activity